MEGQMYLDLLRPGEAAVVTALENDASMRRRLRDVGLIEDTVVECVGESPFHDPVAYCFRGTVMALRKSDSKHIRIRPLKKE